MPSYLTLVVISIIAATYMTNIAIKQGKCTRTILVDIFVYLCKLWLTAIVLRTYGHIMIGQ